MARYIYQKPVRDRQGVIVASATVTVYEAGTTTVATIYEAAAGGDAASTVSTDTDGEFLFYVDDGDYNSGDKFDIKIAKSGYATKTYSNVIVF